MHKARQQEEILLEINLILRNTCKSMKIALCVLFLSQVVYHLYQLLQEYTLEIYFHLSRPRTIIKLICDTFYENKNMQVL